MYLDKSAYSEEEGSVLVSRKAGKDTESRKRGQTRRKKESRKKGGRNKDTKRVKDKGKE